jgi:hypothetical protein
MDGTEQTDQAQTPSVTDAQPPGNTAAAIDFQPPIVPPSGDLGFGFKADGTPKKRPGRPRKDAGPASPAVDKAARKTAEEKAAAMKAECDAVAGMLVSVITSGAESTIGPEWKASDGELKFLTDSASKYMQAKGITELSPGMMLAGALAAYALPRLRHDNTRLKLASTFGGVKGFLVKAYRFVLGK